MAEALLLRLKARLDTPAPAGGAAPEESGWVRGALASLHHGAGHGRGGGRPGRLDSVAAEAPAAQAAARMFWDLGILEAPIPDGFYVLTPNDAAASSADFLSLKDACRVNARAGPGGGPRYEILLVDDSLDPTLAQLKVMVIEIARSCARNMALLIRKVAEVVADVFGGAVFEAPVLPLEPPRPDLVPRGAAPLLLCSLRSGPCRPRAILFKLLLDVLGIHSRLIMGVQVEAVAGAAAACPRPSEHVSNVVAHGGAEWVVDLMRRPGLLRPCLAKSLCLYHVSPAPAPDSDSAGSWDSEPNSPLFGGGGGAGTPPALVGSESPEQEVMMSPRMRGQMRALGMGGALGPPPGPHPHAHHSHAHSHSQGHAPSGLIIPSASTPSLLSPTSETDYASRRRHRRRAVSDERGLLAASPEHPMAGTSAAAGGGASRAAARGRHADELQSVPSSPEHPPWRSRPQSMLGGGRRPRPEDALLSPEHPSQQLARRQYVVEDGDGFMPSPEHGMAIDASRRTVARRRTAGDDSPFGREYVDSPEQSPVHPLFMGDGRPPVAVRRRGNVAADEVEGEVGVPSTSMNGQYLERSSSAGRRGGSDWGPSKPGDAAAQYASTRRRAQGASSSADAGIPGPPIARQNSAPDDRRGRRRNAAPELCPWCRRRCIVDSAAGAEVSLSCGPETYLHRFDRLGLEYPAATSSALAHGPAATPDALSPNMAASAAPGRQSSFHNRIEDVRRFLRAATDADVAPSFAPGAAPGAPPLVHVDPSLRSPSLPGQPLVPYPEWAIDFSELRIGVRVGIGSFGEVFRGIWRGTEVAIKVLLEQDLTPENTNDFCNEISLLSRLRHPNVILFLGACLRPPHLSMVTEYMHMGSLYRLIHTSGQGQKLSWRRRLKMLRDICRGMMCVQRMGIVHRDLKSANCLVDKHWSVKVCDFGLSRIAADSFVAGGAAAGTPEWMAPELLRNEDVTDKCDVFSLGVIMWELAMLRRPWEGKKPTEIMYAVAYESARLEVPEGLLGNLIADCLGDSPMERPSYEEVLTRLHECEFLQA